MGLVRSGGFFRSFLFPLVLTLFQRGPKNRRSGGGVDVLRVTMMSVLGPIIVFILIDIVLR